MQLSENQIKTLIEVYNLLEQRLAFCKMVFSKLDSATEKQVREIDQNYFGIKFEIIKAPTNGKKIGEKVPIKSSPFYERAGLKELFDILIEFYEEIPIHHYSIDRPDEIFQRHIYMLIAHIYQMIEETQEQFRRVQDSHLKCAIKILIMLPDVVGNEKNHSSAKVKIRRLINAAVQEMDYEYLHLKQMYKLLEDAELIPKELLVALNDGYNFENFTQDIDSLITSSNLNLLYLQDTFNSIVEEAVATQSNNKVYSVIAGLVEIKNDLDKKKNTLDFIIAHESTRPITIEYTLSKRILMLQLLNRRKEFDVKIDDARRKLDKYLKPIVLQQEPIATSSEPSVTLMVGNISNIQKTDREEKYQRHIKRLEDRQREVYVNNVVNPEVPILEEEELLINNVRPEFALTKVNYDLLCRFTNPIDVRDCIFKEIDIITLAQHLPCIVLKTKKGYIIISDLDNENNSNKSSRTFGFHRQHNRDGLDRGVLLSFHSWLIDQQFIPDNCVVPGSKNKLHQ